MRYITEIFVPESIDINHKYYGYCHTFDNEYLPFYISIGTQNPNCDLFNRAKEEENRSDTWKKETMSKYYKIEICISSNDYNLIKQWEIDTLLKLQKSNILNKTKGGEGSSGYKHTSETKEKISKSNKGKTRSLQSRLNMKVSASIRSDNRKFDKIKEELKKHIEYNKLRPDIDFINGQDY